jgi:hypothetical protein
MNKGCGDEHVYDGCAYQRLDIPGIEDQGALEETARLHHIPSRHTLVDADHALKVEVHRVWARCSVRAACFGRNELRVQRVGESRDNLILHVKEVGDWLLETLGPKMTPVLCVDELDIHAHAAAAALNAPFKRMANVEFAPDLLRVDGLPLIGVGGVAGYDERASNA